MNPWSRNDDLLEKGSYRTGQYIALWMGMRTVHSSFDAVQGHQK